MLQLLHRRLAGDTPLPTLVYDDDCGFCTWAAAFAATRSEVVPVGFSELSVDQRARLPPNYEACVHLLTADETYFCGRAVEETFCLLYPALSGGFRRLRRVPYYPSIRERLYELVSNNRDRLGRVVSAFSSPLR